MHCCKFCGHHLLERSLLFGYKMNLPCFNKFCYDSHKFGFCDSDMNHCRFLEIGLSKRPSSCINQTDDVIIKLSVPFTHCTQQRRKNSSEISVEIEEWRALMNVQESIERYFANVAVLNQYVLSSYLTMYFDTYNHETNNDDDDDDDGGGEGEKSVFLVKGGDGNEENETISTIRISRQIATLLFTLKSYIDELHSVYLAKVPYTNYVFNKFVDISELMVCTLKPTTDFEHQRFILGNHIRNHWFYNSQSTIHNELLEMCLNELINIVVHGRKGGEGGGGVNEKKIKKN